MRREMKLNLTEVRLWFFYKNQRIEGFRKDAFETLFGTYKGFKNTLTTALTSSIREYLFSIRKQGSMSSP
jgi:oligoendopeptidase F